MQPLKRTVNTNFMKASKEALEAGQNQWVYKPRSDGKEYTFTKREMPSADIKKKLKKSVFNDRGVDYLIGTACVSDIIDEIRVDKRPRFPGVVVGDGSDKGIVVTGNRRAHAVSLIDGAVFEYWYCDQMDDVDIQALAQASDRYDEPCPADRVFALRHILEVEGRDEISRTELCQRWGLSTTAVSDITTVARVMPDAFFELFPALRYVPWNKTKGIAKKFSKEQVAKAVEQVQGASKDLDDEDAKREGQRIIEEISLILSPPRAKRAVPPRWQFESKKGVEIKAGNKGAVTITLKSGVLTHDQEAEIIRILSEN